jgi:hypothetical protein
MSGRQRRTLCVTQGDLIPEILKEAGSRALSCPMQLGILGSQLRETDRGGFWKWISALTFSGEREVTHRVSSLILGEKQAKTH